MVQFTYALDDVVVFSLYYVQRLLFTGSPEERAGDIAQLEAAGVSTMIVNVTSNNLSHMLERVERFSSDVIALLV